MSRGFITTDRLTELLHTWTETHGTLFDAIVEERDLATMKAEDARDLMGDDSGWDARVTIPGMLCADYAGDLDGGEIVRWTFTPSAGYAGYFGSAAEIIDAGDMDDEDYDERCGIDVESSEGAFWAAVTRSLGDGDFVVAWTE